MTLKEFLQNDIFRNTLIAKPHFEFSITNGKVVKINNNPGSYIGTNDVINNAQILTYGMFNFSLSEQSFLLAVI